MVVHVQNVDFISQGKLFFHQCIYYKKKGSVKDVCEKEPYAYASLLYKLRLISFEQLEKTNQKSRSIK